MKRLFLLLLISLFSCKGDSLEKEQPSFVGKWSLLVASLDGNVRDEWQDQMVVFTSTSDTSGTWELSKSIIDSVWNQYGNWSYKKEKYPNTFTTSDGVEVTFIIKSDSLQLNYQLPGYSTCYTDTICDSNNVCEIYTECTLQFSGSWQFLLWRFYQNEQMQFFSTPFSFQLK